MPANKQKEPHRILILVDSTQRDLPGHMLLKRILETKLHCQVKLINGRTPHTAVLSFKPHAVVLPMMYSALNKHLAYYCKSKEISVFFLATEGYPNVPDDDFLDYVAGRYCDFRPIDMNFVWCEEIAKRAILYNVLSSERICLAGLPRFDYYHHSMRALRLSREEFVRRHHLDPSLPVLTWASNFPGVNLTLEEHLRGIEETNAQHIGVYRDAEKVLANEQDSLKRTVTLLDNWMSQHGHKVNLVIRPHPLDNWPFFQRFVQSLKAKGIHNVVCIPEGPISDILSSTDIQMQRACTTAVEAFLLNIPVLELRLNTNELLVQSDRDDCVEVCCNEAEFNRKITPFLQGKTLSADIKTCRERYIQKWFYRVDGYRTYEAAKKMAAYLNDHRKEPLIGRSEVRFGNLFAQIRKWQFALKPHKISRAKATYMRQCDQDYWEQRVNQSGVLDQFSEANVGASFPPS